MKPGIERVPAAYDPGYPRALARSEYDECIAPDQRQRIVAAAAAAASLALAPPSAAQGRGQDDERVAAVLRVLNEGGAGESSWFARASFKAGKDAQGNPTVLPAIPISYGNSMNGVFDANRARRLASELFAAYGLRPLADHRLVEQGVEATLDVYDPAKRVGVELRGAMPRVNGMFGGAEPEPEAVALDDAEHARLAASGNRVQRVDLDSFPLMDGDQATPMLAYLAGIVAFLNEVAGGPELDLTSILSKERMRIALPETEVAPGSRFTPGQKFQTDVAATITLTIDPARGYERAVDPDRRRGEPEWRAAEPTSRPGSAPLLLEVRAYPAAAITVEQDGTEPLRVEAAGSLAFLPPRFDPARPFRITLRLESGENVVEPHLVLYGLPR
jgi:hypothetical protein